MNLSPDWLEVFELAGISAEHWVARGSPMAADHEIFEEALRRGEIVFTNDLDFGTLLRESRSGKPSVVQLRTSDTSPKAQGDRIICALRKYEAALLAGAIVTITPARQRVSILPLG